MACRSLILTTLLVACSSASASTEVMSSSYAGQESREIKALSAEEVQGYLSGKGMGLAKAAELNGLPGPSHVVALSAKLGLTAEQEVATRRLFSSMEANAISFGRQLVAEERHLDGLFATKAITPEELTSSLTRIGALQAKVRGAHLEAHIAQTKLLSPEQVALYMRLRGYSANQDINTHSRRHHQ